MGSAEKMKESVSFLEKVHICNSKILRLVALKTRNNPAQVPVSLFTNL